MKSSTLYYYFLKLVALMLFAFPLVLAWAATSGKLDDGSGAPPPPSLLAQAVAASLLALGLGWVIWRQFAIIECSGTGLKLRRNGRTTAHTWGQVASVSQVPFCTPPVYRITFSNGELPAYCIFFSFVVATVGIWSWDFRGFVKYAQSHIDNAQRAPTAHAFQPPPKPLF
jgi:hypothetical protein